MLSFQTLALSPVSRHFLFDCKESSDDSDDGSEDDDDDDDSEHSAERSPIDGDTAIIPDAIRTSPSPSPPEQRRGGVTSMLRDCYLRFKSSCTSPRDTRPLTFTYPAPKAGFALPNSKFTPDLRR